MKKRENKKIGMAFLAAAVLLSFSSCKNQEKPQEEREGKNRRQRMGEGGKYTIRKISGACNLYAGPDERGE